MSKKYNIFIDSNDGRFCNQLYPLFVGLTYYEHNKEKFNKIYFCNIITYLNVLRLDSSLFFRLPKKLTDLISIDIDEYNSITENNTSESYVNYPIKLPQEFNNNLRIHGYCQTASKIDVNVIRKYFECPKDIKNKIYELYGDISNYVCLHVRRGDYVNDCKYRILSKEYINYIKETYCSDKKIICISDDMTWCKENLNDINDIVFADKSDDVLIDFYIGTITKCNVCSNSSFSLASAILNPNNNIYVPYPYYRYEPFNYNEELKIIPSYANKIDYDLFEE